MATPAIRAVRHRYPNSRLIAVGRPYVFGVLEGSPWLNEFIPFDGRGAWSQRLLAVASQLRKHSIDLGLIVPNSFRSALAAWLGRCARRVGYVRYCRSRLLTDRLLPICDSNRKLKPSPI